MGVIQRKTKAMFYLMGFVGFVIAIALIVYPESAFDASVRGLDVWWNIAFPALLPFFVAAEVLMGLGVVHFIGVLLEPLMRPLFRVPGIGAFVFAVGLASGYPVGAMLSARYRERGELSKEEGERLMCFTNTADPLFMSGAVAVGMLGWPQIGVTIAIVHYLSTLCTGLMMRFYKPKAIPSGQHRGSKGFILHRAGSALVTARQKDNRTFGTLMGDAIKKSMNSLLVVGGYIILFSVVIELFNTSGIAEKIAAALSMSMESVLLFTNGLLEITLGCQRAAQSSLGVQGSIVIISAIIAWSGVSVLGQVASFISSTDLSIRPYIFARLVHATLAAFFTALLFKFNLVPALPSAAVDYVTLGLGARYLFATTTLLKVLLIWAGAGLGTMILTALFHAKIATFRINHPKS